MLNMLDAKAHVDADRGRADPRRSARPGPLRGAQGGGRAARGRGLPGPAYRQGRRGARRRAAHDPDALRRPLGRGDRAVADRPMVCRCRDAGASRRSRRCARARSRSCRRPGRRPFSTGWRTSSPGACRGSCGGGTGFRPGLPRTASIFVAETEEEAQAQAGRGRSAHGSDRGRPRHLVLLRALAVRDDGLARRTPTATLAGRYPNDVLISGFDILFFWDARMMMQGLHFMKEVPFKTLVSPRPGPRRGWRRRCPSPRAIPSIRSG